MDPLRENIAKYFILTIVGVLIAFGIDHYLFGDKMNDFVGITIGISPTLSFMFRDVFREV